MSYEVYRAADSLEKGAEEHNVEVFKMRSAERCSSFFLDNLKNEISFGLQVALIKFNDLNCIIFGPKKEVKLALKQIEAFN
jgi:hypothetical protein